MKEAQFGIRLMVAMHIAAEVSAVPDKDVLPQHSETTKLLMSPATYFKF